MKQEERETKCIGILIHRKDDCHYCTAYDTTCEEYKSVQDWMIEMKERRK